MSLLIPDYLNIDYTTLVERFRDELSESQIFKDYLYEGSNISVLLELMSYIGELNTFYLNKIAKNQFFDTSEQYENVNRMISQQGYYPKGYVSSFGTLDVSIPNPSGSGINNGDYIVVDKWGTISSTEVYNDEEITFVVLKDIEEQITDVSVPFQFNVNVKQGIPIEYEYKGSNINEYEIILPFNIYDHQESTDDIIYIELYVNDEMWSLVYNFYDEISGLIDNNNVYRFEYDKYQRYKILFSPVRNVPKNNDDIRIKLIQTIGENGNVGANTINNPSNNFIRIKNGSSLNIDAYTIENGASTGGKNPETLSELKIKTPEVVNTQFRNVTSNDYITHLKQRQEVRTANVWGEKEENPLGSILLFNKVYVTLIPKGFSSDTIDETGSWNEDYKETISRWLETRKMLNIYEEYVDPSFVYFSFDIGIKIRRNYVFDHVVNDIKDKIVYYFSLPNMSFGQTFYFNDLEEFIRDNTKVDQNNKFSNIRGIRNLVIRDISIDLDGSPVIQEPGHSNYPQYLEETYTYNNNLRNIVLGFNQFPLIDIDNCNVLEEN